MLATRGHANRRGLAGWTGGGPDRWLYSLHRVTGLALLLYFVMHIGLTTSRAFGAESWAAAMGKVTGQIFVLGEYLVFLAFVFHALNGLRLFFAELGIVIGKPIEPIYPYRTCLSEQRPYVIVMLVLAAIIAVVGGLDFFTGGH